MCGWWKEILGLRSEEPTWAGGGESADHVSRGDGRDPPLGPPRDRGIITVTLLAVSYSFPLEALATLDRDSDAPSRFLHFNSIDASASHEGDGLGD